MKPHPRILALPLLLSLALPARAAEVDELITSNTTITAINVTPSPSVTYRIASGGTLFVEGSKTGSGNGGTYYMNTGGLVKIGPDTPGGDGMVVFQNNNTANGGVIYIGTSGTLMLENALFRSNTVATTAAGVFLNANGGLITLKNVVFERNVA
ncbi:MAG: hypothetical protein LBM92_06850, partial [Opitutaceae bacterium]|nr:hypothetical protein [Opitutaceae bacterium]